MLEAPLNEFLLNFSKYFLKIIFTKRGAFITIGIVMMISALLAIVYVMRLNVDYSTEFDKDLEQSYVLIFSFEEVCFLFFIVSLKHIY